MRHDKAEPSGGPPPLPWWKAHERTPREEAWVGLGALAVIAMFIAGLGVFLHHGASAWPVLVLLWGTSMALFGLLQRWELRKRKEQRDREQAMLQAAP